MMAATSSIAASTKGKVYLQMQGACCGLPLFDRDAEERHRAIAQALCSRSNRSPRGLNRDAPIERICTWPGPLDDAALDTIFRTARTANGYTDAIPSPKPISAASTTW
jgi:hypothetical protein